MSECRVDCRKPLTQFPPPSLFPLLLLRKISEYKGKKYLNYLSIVFLHLLSSLSSNTQSLNYYKKICYLRIFILYTSLLCPLTPPPHLPVPSEKITENKGKLYLYLKKYFKYLSIVFSHLLSSKSSNIHSLNHYKKNIISGYFSLISENPNQTRHFKCCLLTEYL